MVAYHPRRGPHSSECPAQCGLPGELVELGGRPIGCQLLPEELLYPMRGWLWPLGRRRHTAGSIAQGQ